MQAHQGSGADDLASVELKRLEKAVREIVDNAQLWFGPWDESSYVIGAKGHEGPLGRTFSVQAYRAIERCFTKAGRRI